MTIQELFIRSNEELKKVIQQIKPDQWDLDMPAGTSRTPIKLKDAVNYHTYDDAWVPDVLDGKKESEIGDVFLGLKTTADDKVLSEYLKYNELANEKVHGFSKLDTVVHLSYGDYPAADYLQHIISFRGFRTYDIAKLIGIDATMAPDLVQGLWDEFSPVIDDYRKLGVFPPAIEVATDANLQTKLLAMVGRE